MKNAYEYYDQWFTLFLFILDQSIRRMSDFIQIDSKHDLSKEPMDLIKGLISRISFCNRPTVFSKSSHQHYFSRKVS